MKWIAEFMIALEHHSMGVMDSTRTPEMYESLNMALLVDVLDYSRGFCL